MKRFALAVLFTAFILPMFLKRCRWVPNDSDARAVRHSVCCERAGKIAPVAGRY
jgi:hypothetical protein